MNSSSDQNGRGAEATDALKPGDMQTALLSPSDGDVGRGMFTTFDWREMQRTRAAGEDEFAEAEGLEVVADGVPFPDGAMESEIGSSEHGAGW